MTTTFVFLHSPAVGPSTWEPVAAALERRGRPAVIPDLTGVTAGGPPTWPRVVDVVRAAAPETPLVLVAHSSAGLFAPVVKEGLGDRVVACVFADAHVPPPQGLVRAAEERRLEFLRARTGDDGLLPRWTDWWKEEVVAAMLPDPAARARVVAEQPRLPLAFFTERIPVPAGWDRVRCSCLWYGPPYDVMAEEAERRGWPVTRVPGGHLHQMVDPEAVAGALLKLSRVS
ncbi:alpha/beta hydrolase [Nonomuraea rhodomycinica]|uniref:Alpha/beta hydrolase n=1 Tax=Nonomuraea rhodomycinica TaxID=1712872 RepID=A0A7Y6M9E4_9ACTN|nr:alpha/beta hydrolase [Nonomuraea rhodomycinica]NUW40113.1 alpha/beta hydrolase [Nonomuraea rhodomycinica]